MAESKEKPKNLLMKVKEENEKADFKLNVQKMKIDHGFWPHLFMKYRWGSNGNSDRIYFLGLQNHYRWWLQTWIKRCLLLGRKAMTNLGSILKSRDITLPTKVLLVKVTFFFPVAMQACVGWTIKKAENQRIDTLNCGVGENSWESLGLQGDQTSPS